MESIDSGSSKELESKKGYILNRVVNLNSPDELRGGFGIGNLFMKSRGEGLDAPPGFFFWSGIPGNPRSFKHRMKQVGLSNHKVEVIKMGNNLGWDVSNGRKMAEAYLAHSPYVAHLLISISPDNFRLFQSLISLVTSKGSRET